MGLWSISTHLSNSSKPSIRSWGAAFNVVAPLSAVAASGYKVPFISVDLPEPDTPVTHVITPTGIFKSTVFRLLPVAPISLRNCLSLAWCRIAGISIFRLPVKNCPVMDSGQSIMSCGVPLAMIWPPWTPAPGPISTTKSATRMASSSCSTTITVLPKSLSLVSVAIRRSLSLWCKPMDGSSRMYITPTNPAPIWLASRMRCASPPDSESALRSRVRYSRPTLTKNVSLSRISFSILEAISPREPGNSSVSKYFKHSAIG